MFHVVETSVYELINRNNVCTALGRMDLGRNDLSRGGTTVVTSSSSVVNARWGSSTPLPDFPISGNHFPITVILLISGYREIISRYRKMRFISRYRELFPDIGKMNSQYQKIILYFPISEIRIPDIGKSFPDIGNYFPISGNPNGFQLFIISRYRKLFSDIGNSNSRYREMISRYREFEFRISGNMELISDIGNSISRYQEIIPDIEKWISFSDI